MIKIKMHMMPGDVTKQEKASMLEGRNKNRKASKSFRNMIYARTRAVLKERTRKEIDSTEYSETLK